MNKSIKKIVSVVITTRNRRDYLIQCLNSINNSIINKIFDLEVIIVDDYSDDSVREINITDFRYDLIIIRNPSLQMMVKSRNIGARKATGEFVLFIDDDNTFEKKMISNLAMYLTRNHQVGLVGPSIRYADKDKPYFTSQKINLYTGKTTGNKDFSVIEQSSDGIPNLFMTRKSLLEEVNFFDEDIVQSMTEPDYSYKINLLGYKTIVLSNVMTIHHAQSGNISERILLNTFKQKAYYLTRNRFVIIKRYGNLINLLSFVVFFSWFLLFAYLFIAIKGRDLTLIRLYIIGHYDGLKFALLDKLDSHSQSLSRIKDVLSLHEK